MRNLKNYSCDYSSNEFEQTQNQKCQKKYMGLNQPMKLTQVEIESELVISTQSDNEEDNEMSNTNEKSDEKDGFDVSMQRQGLNSLRANTSLAVV